MLLVIISNICSELTVSLEFSCFVLLRKCSVLSLLCSRNIGLPSNIVAGRVMRMHARNMLRAIVLICAQLVYVYKLNSQQLDPLNDRWLCAGCMGVGACVQ